MGEEQEQDYDQVSIMNNLNSLSLAFGKQTLFLYIYFPKSTLRGYNPVMPVMLNPYLGIFN